MAIDFCFIVIIIIFYKGISYLLRTRLKIDYIFRNKDFLNRETVSLDIEMKVTRKLIDKREFEKCSCQSTYAFNSKYWRKNSSKKKRTNLQCESL